MTPMQGLATDAFGRWLTDWVAGNSALADYRVFYDHGDSALDNVAAIKGFHGGTVTNVNRLADVDVMVTDPRGNVAILIEIEERESSPKKALGNAVTIAMCSRFAVGRAGAQKYFAVTKATRLVISGIMPDGGDRVRKIDEVVAPRFRESSGFVGGVLPSQVDFIFAPTIDEILDKIKAIVALVLNA